MTFDKIDVYLDEFKCSDTYRRKYEKALWHIFCKQKGASIDYETWNLTRAGKYYYAADDKVAEKLNVLNDNYNVLLNNMLRNAEQYSTFKKESLFNNKSFKKPAPILLASEDRPEEPQENNIRYAPTQVKVPLIQRLMNTNAEAEAKEEAERQANLSFLRDHEKWERDVKLFEQEQEACKSKYNEWMCEKQSFEEAVARENATAKDMIKKAEAGDPECVAHIFKLAIDGIELPFKFKIISSTEFQPDQKRLVVDVDLPVLEDLPRIKSIKYNKSKNQIDYKYQTDTYMKKLYDTVVYQTVLLILYHCFKYKEITKVIEAVVLNGYVNTIDPASGKKIHPCILSVATDRDSFENLVFESVDAKAWFKSVKGVAAAKIELCTPVPPIIQLNKSDHRFVEAYDVSNQIDISTNLASMDWKDFENLVREVFEEEFKVNGGEVRVTQASRDGGVDAIAFDPDPIRGGKIVIQAKRYTNIVGVSAVRDLYGTVMNEGANKGILVTTAGYGNDAYEFAKDKPITLLDGGNLLALLEKHGHKARINIKEAKEML